MSHRAFFDALHLAKVRMMDRDEMVGDELINRDDDIGDEMADRDERDEDR